MSLEIGSDADPQHWHEQTDAANGNRLNALRAAVLGANDGIVSTAGIVMGVAGATNNRTALLIAGVAGLVAGAMSMGTGEYVSVSTQRDSEKSILRLEAQELEAMPETEQRELAKMYEEKGLDPELATQVAAQLTAHDALAAHADIEFGIDPDELTNPWHAALASMISFTLGALLPLLCVVLVPASARIMVTVLAVVIALAIAGLVSAHLQPQPAPARDPPQRDRRPALDGRDLPDRLARRDRAGLAAPRPACWVGLRRTAPGRFPRICGGTERSRGLQHSRTRQNPPEVRGTAHQQPSSEVAQPHFAGAHSPPAGQQAALRPPRLERWHTNKFPARELWLIPRPAGATRAHPAPRWHGHLLGARNVADPAGRRGRRAGRRRAGRRGRG